MKTKKWLLLSITVSLLTSCIDLQVDRQYTSDVVLVSKIINGDTLYAIDCYVWANDAIDSIRCNGTTNLEFNQKLNSIDDASRSFEYTTPELKYSMIIPAASNYTFTVYHSDGTIKLLYDEVSTQAAQPTTIESIGWDNQLSQLHIEWLSRTGVGAYNIRIFDTQGNSVFNSAYYTSETTSIDISSNTYTWFSSPNYADTLYVWILGIMLEEESATIDNIQSIGYSEKKQILWRISN